MQIVINIDEEDYDDITLTGENTINLGVLLDLREAVRKGILLPKGHGRIGDLNKLESEMYHEAFETDTELQKWDSGCWIRYKMFENAIANAQTIIEADEVKS